MSHPKSTYHSKVYRDFKEVEATAFRTIIRFYESFENEIRKLEFGEYFELLIAYTNALFEVGSYQKHLLMADVAIEASVMHNIKFFGGVDIFHQMLFKKAASCYHSKDYPKADYILRELIRIDPFDKDAILFLKKCLRRMRPDLIQNTRAASVFLFFMVIVLVCVEVLAVNNFYERYHPLVKAARNTVFFLAWAVLIAGDLRHRWRVNKEVENFVAAIKKKKQKSGLVDEGVPIT